MILERVSQFIANYLPSTLIPTQMSVKLIQHNVVKIDADFGFFRSDCDLNDALLPMQSKLANPVVRICIDSLQQHAVGDYFVSLKPPTVSCEESLPHRYNPLTDKLGVDASWEVKTLIRERKKRALHATRVSMSTSCLLM